MLLLASKYATSGVRTLLLLLGLLIIRDGGEGVTFEFCMQRRRGINKNRLEIGR